MAVGHPWNRIIEHWQACNIQIRPTAPGATAAFEAKYGVVMPSSVREYFLTVDGTGDDVDDDIYRFWPLSENKPVHEELTSGHSDRFAYPGCFVFADFCCNCWLYAVRLTDDPEQPAPVNRVTGSADPGEQIASSFLEFMGMYAKHPDNII